MVEYSFELKLEGANSSDSSVQHTLDLKPFEEDYPEKIFNSENCETIRRNLQLQSSCRITDANLNRIIQTWIADIREGYRNTTMTLNLPLLIGDELDNLNDHGNQDLPELMAPDLSEIEPQDGALPSLTFSTETTLNYVAQNERP